MTYAVASLCPFCGCEWVAVEGLTAYIMDAALDATFVRQVVDGMGRLHTRIDQIAVERAQELPEAHRCVRVASGVKHLRYDVRPQLPVDVVGLFVLLPKVV